MISLLNSTAVTSLQKDPNAQLNKEIAAKSTEFESMMIEQLLNNVQKTFTEVGGDDTDAGSDTLSGIGTQALAKGLAENGGIGIAKMLREALSTQHSAKLPR